MRIFDIFKPKRKALSNYGQWQELFLNRGSSGVVVTNKTALSISTVYACIRNISEDVAKVGKSYTGQFLKQYLSKKPISKKKK